MDFIIFTDKQIEHKDHQSLTRKTHSMFFTHSAPDCLYGAYTGPKTNVAELKEALKNELHGYRYGIFPLSEELHGTNIFEWARTNNEYLANERKKWLAGSVSETEYGSRFQRLQMKAGRRTAIYEYYERGNMAWQVKVTGHDVQFHFPPDEPSITPIRRVQWVTEVLNKIVAEHGRMRGPG